MCHNKIFYLDHNIFIKTLDDEELYRFLIHTKQQGVEFVYSPAHIEEIYKVLANSDSPYRSKMIKLLDNISNITDNNEILPDKNQLIKTIEPPQNCLERVCEFDTREVVEQNSEIIFDEDKTHYSQMLTEDKENQNISNIPPEKIFEYPQIKGCIDTLNDNISIVISNYNNYIINLILQLCGREGLPDDFCFQNNRYNKLKKSHTELEYTIEILFRILNNYGYVRDQSYHTTLSGIHDVSHAIYATKTDHLVSTDKRFAKKCKAVYHYLGVNTTVTYCKQDTIINGMKSLLQDTEAQ